MQDAPKPEDVAFPPSSIGPILRLGPTNQGGESGVTRDSADVEGGRGVVDFADAEAVLAGSLGDEGADAWTPVGFARRRDLEIGILSTWADNGGLWISDDAMRGIERGRMEHDLIYVGTPPHRVKKLTRGHRYGFYPHADPTLVSGMVSDWFGLKPGTPRQYLRRMALTHELFPALEHRLEGFAMLDGQFRIVISQRFIDPVAASQKAIANFLTGAGFEQLLAEAWYRAADNVAIFDTGTTNVLEFAGRLFPIDIVPLRPDEFMLEKIQAALKIPFGLR